MSNESALFAASNAPAAPAGGGSVLGALIMPTMVVMYTTNDELGLRARMVQAAVAKFAGMQHRHINPRYFEPGTAPAGARAVILRESFAKSHVQVEIDGQARMVTVYDVLHGRSPDAEFIIVPDAEADAINQPFVEERYAQTSGIDQLAIERTLAQVQTPAAQAATAADPPLIPVGGAVPAATGLGGGPVPLAGSGEQTNISDGPAATSGPSNDPNPAQPAAAAAAASGGRGSGTQQRRT